ncbi:MAG: Na/Pi cotransporter family protein [bacterium]
MISLIVKILTLVGSLSLFLFGMRLMSESLLKVAGTKMRAILSTITASKFKSILTGFAITSIIQSSSASTVMIVSFVNAGLLGLAESVGVIMGANIGTTFTAWFISLLGFNIKISTLTIPLVGLAFPLLFSAKTSRRYWGEFIVGFALIFLGLEFLKTTVPDIHSNPEMIEFLSEYTQMGYGSIFIFMLAGILLTIIIQSSSAAIALTLVMCYQGWIGFDLAAAMILGENIGTTITANIAAFVANTAAKKAARAHFIFNLLGAVWLLLIFPVFLKGVDLVVQYFTDKSVFTHANSLPVGLAVFHSAFNIVNVFILVGFIPVILKLSSFLIFKKSEDIEHYKLTHLSTGVLSTDELSILQAKKEIVVYARRVQKMFRLVRQLFSSINDKEFYQITSRINNYEEICDRMEVEIAGYLIRLSEGEISKPGSKRLRIMLRVVDEIESIGDSCYNISKNLNRKKEQKIWFTQDIRNNLNNMFDKIEEAYAVMIKNLEADYKDVDPGKAIAIEKEINHLRNSYKQEHLDNIENRSYKYQAGVIYTDILSQAESLGDHIVNVTKSIAG